MKSGSLTFYWQVLAIGLNPIDWKAPYVQITVRVIRFTNFIFSQCIQLWNS